MVAKEDGDRKDGSDESKGRTQDQPSNLYI